jgi:hypothetical protein
MSRAFLLLTGLAFGAPGQSQRDDACGIGRALEDALRARFVGFYKKGASRALKFNRNHALGCGLDELDCLPDAVFVVYTRKDPHPTIALIRCVA